MLFNILLFITLAVSVEAKAKSSASEIRTYDDLTQLIIKNSIVSIDDLLTHLPQDYKNGHALIYSTQALGRNLVSPRRPRVLFFGSSGDFMMTVNSHPSGGKAKPGDIEKLETIEFVGDKTLLRELEFDGMHSPLSKTVEVNPARCLTCHGADPRGLWDPYNMWPGVYGSLSRGRVDFIAVNSQEHRYFQDFLNEKITNPRYSFIQHQYLNLSQVDSSKLLIPYDPNMQDAVVLNDGNTTFPNQILGMIIGDHNLRRLGRVLTAAPVQRRSKIQYLVEAIRRDEEAFLAQSGFIDLKQMKFECSGNLADFFPQAKFRYTNFPEFHRFVMEMNSQDHLRQKSLVNQFNHGLAVSDTDFDESDPFDLQVGKTRGSPYAPVSLTHIWDAHFKGRLTASVLAYVFYLAGLPYQELSTSINAGRFNLYYGNSIECSGSTTHAGSRKCFYHGVDIFFERFLPKTFFTNRSLAKMTCDDLKAASRAALRRL